MIISLHYIKLFINIINIRICNNVIFQVNKIQNHFKSFVWKNKYSILDRETK